MVGPIHQRPYGPGPTANASFPLPPTSHLLAFTFYLLPLPPSLFPTPDQTRFTILPMLRFLHAYNQDINRRYRVVRILLLRFEAKHC